MFINTTMTIKDWLVAVGDIKMWYVALAGAIWMGLKITLEAIILIREWWCN